ncbi:MAG: class II glutamine amidotransferase [Labilithrix sp.]|nr:class II glutamine amidotransferase [Labilithrix sp.]MCW5812811.1 class II glutamine amidotransferase [Labilithrix sp.]
MCRLVGIVASEVSEFGLVLKEAPRSLARLSREHPDGWGVAAHGDPEAMPPPSTRSPHENGWRIHKGTRPAGECDRFHQVAARSVGNVLVAHVRQKTIGPTRIENTHPFVQSGWVFAHNGTLKDYEWIREAISIERRAQLRGDTDSEVLFAYVLTHLDTAGVTLTTAADPAARAEATRVLDHVAAEMRARQAGAFNFLLSDGASLFVHRFGRSLFLLERGPSDPIRTERDIDSSASLETPWTKRRHAALIASERLTDEPWRELPEGTFLRIDLRPKPTIIAVNAPDRAA